jgi:hypothetical protein
MEMLNPVNTTTGILFAWFPTTPQLVHHITPRQCSRPGISVGRRINNSGDNRKELTSSFSSAKAGMAKLIVSPARATIERIFIFPSQSLDWSLVDESEENYSGGSTPSCLRNSATSR